MSSVVIAGDTSGTVTLSAPAVSGTTTLTLPATSGTLLQSGTAVTAAQGGTGLTTVGTSVTYLPLMVLHGHLLLPLLLMLVLGWLSNKQQLQQVGLKIQLRGSMILC